MAFRIINSNPQSRVKDCYAPSPTINLTLRSNGEEKVQVMDCLGNLVQAGFDAITLAPSQARNTIASSFNPASFWFYLYVYVAKTAYPLVENAVTGGGSPAPRSSPSPPSNIILSSINQVVVTIPTSQRSDISHIWIYRTGFFDTNAEALTNAEGGVAFWIGEIANNPNNPTVTFIDDNTNVGQEQVEEDNFPAPQFQNGIFVDPFFWGFGNNELVIEVTIAADGFITINDQVNNKWFDGRDAQIINFDGITNGGSDGQGNYYFKAIDNFTAQVYDDITLLAPGSFSRTGITRAHIKGQCTTLYRSKPYNPFSWGQTDLIGDVQVPSLYNFTLGGGIGTAIGVIPNLNLLKLDTESPGKCFTLNLKNAGTSNFEPSLRVISDLSVSSQHVQFSAINSKGYNVIWGLDTKAFSIVECDGGNQTTISSNVYKILRTIALEDSDRAHFTGIYCPRLEINCIFIRTNGAVNSINRLIYYHWPTDQWGTIDVFDIMAVAQVLDPTTNELKIIVGASSGYIGELFSRFDGFSSGANWLANWIAAVQDGTADADNTKVNAIDFALDQTGLVNNWAVVIYDAGLPTAQRYFAKVANYNAGAFQIQFSNFLNPDYTTATNPVGFVGKVTVAIGIIEIEVGRFFTLQTPFDQKKLLEVWSTWLNLNTNADLGLHLPTVQFGIEYAFDYWVDKDEDIQGHTYEQNLLPQQSGVPDTPATTIMALKSSIPLDFARSVGVVFRDRSVFPSQLMNYELRMENPDGSNS